MRKISLILFVVLFAACSPPEETPTRTPEEVTVSVTANPFPTATHTPEAVEPTIEPTPTSLPTPTELEIAIALAEQGVTTNSDWTSTTQTFDGVEMALVPAGCFEMGNIHYNNQSPVHRVCFEEPFWIDVYEVTNKQVGLYDLDYCTQFSSADDEPRICIGWVDAKSHCESRNGRLPTEAEWEYAARGPDSLHYPWGNEQVAGNGAFYDGAFLTRPVGSYPNDVSWVGVYDMAGNVREWVSDLYDGDYFSTLIDGVVNPQGPQSGELRVKKGGSFYDQFPRLYQVSWRIGQNEISVQTDEGVRCARSYVD